jgi:RHS repeat-associated protein
LYLQFFRAINPKDDLYVSHSIPIKQHMKRTLFFIFLSAAIIEATGQSCSTCGTNSTYGSIGDGVGPSFRVSLGTAQYGQAAGNLFFEGGSPDPALFTTAALQFDSSRVDVTVVTNSDGSIRQVAAPQALADIPIPPTTNGYVINFYYSSQVTNQSGGLFTFSDIPYVTWMITNCDPSTINQIQISQTGSSYGLMKQWNYTYSTNTGAWSVQPLGGAIQGNMSISNLSEDSYQIISSLQSPSGSNASQVKQTWQTFYWSYCTNIAVSQISAGSDGASEITSYTYWDPQIFGAGNLNLVATITHADGSWENYASYDTNGNPLQVYSSFEDVSIGNYWNGREIDYTYDPTVAGVSSSGDDGTANPNVPRSTVGYLEGYEVSRRYTVFPSLGVCLDIQCTVPGAAWNDPGNLVTSNVFYTSGPNQFDLRAVIRPDGTMTTYDYATNSAGTYKTNMTTTGQADSTCNYIVDGTTNWTVLNQFGSLVSSVSQDIKSGIILTQDVYSNFDSYGRPQQVTHLGGTTEQTYYACCGLDSTVDRDGVTTQYLYDDSKRQIGYQRIYAGNTITFTNVLDAAGQTLKSVRIGSDNSQIILDQAAYDLAGELLFETNALWGVTVYNRTNNSNTGGLILTTINPDAGTITNIYYADGSLKEVIGTATHGTSYSYGVGVDVNGNTCAYTTETKLSADGMPSSEWTQTFTDIAGRTTEILYADNSYSQLFYNRFGQLTNQIDPDGVSTLYQYNAKGEVAYTAADMNQNGAIDFGGIDRITWTTNDVTSDHSTNVRRSRTYVWDTLNANSSSLVSVVETSTDGLKSWQTQYRDASTAVTSQTQTAYGANRTVTATAPDNSYTISVYSSGRPASVTRYDSLNNQLSSINYSYDAHGRQYQVTDARNGATTYGYNSADLLSSVTTPNPGNGGSPQTTVTYYNKMLQTTNVLQPDGTSVTNEYFLTGELKKTYGSRTYPVSYAYDYAGRMKTMTTWQNFAAGGGTAVTTWNYDAQRGWLTNKAYADSYGPLYTYTPAGRLSSRTWARGVVTTNVYDAAGGLYSVNYSDSTPGVTNTFDRLGRPVSVLGGGMTETLLYNLANELLSDSWSGGVLNGLAVTNGYDAYLRRFAVGLSTQPSTLTQFGYDNASRLSSVTNGSNTAGYTYLANSPLVGQIAFKQSGTTRMTTTKQYDYLNRLTSISSAPSGTGVAPVSFSYTYNSANQRAQSALVDGSYWSYNYDALGQVTSGKKYWADGTPVAGQQFEYGFDDIGNRKNTKAGGDDVGSSLRLANYTNNTLNQITGRDVPGYVDIKGISIATNTVTVAGLTAYRKGEYFRKELSVGNSSAALWTNIVVAATGQTSTTGNVFVAKAPETFTYDLDGNLTGDGRWTYGWDAENRLTNMTSLSTGPAGSKLKLDFAYDSQGRRIQKTVSTNNGSAYVGQYTNKFVYDGWNLIAILNPQSSILQSFVWGLDLSGSPQGAAGVGGLLEAVNYGISTNFVAYDGNGSVAALVKANDGTTGAQYEYAPFGETIRVTGPIARANPFRFSTKYEDDETDLCYYGHRYYSSSDGRWLSRDRIAENGGLNLYGLVNNNPISSFDPVGDCRCGIKSFKAIADNWEWDSAKPPTWLAFHFHVTAQFKNDTTYKPSCCKLIQWRQDTTTLNGKIWPADGGQPTDGKLHIDANPYSSGDDVTNPKNWIASLSNDVTDTVGYKDRPTRGGKSGDVLGGDLRFRIVVYDACYGFQQIATTGFKVWWQGTWPKIKYGNN